MPNHGKGGRKPERGEAKRSAIAVRTTATIKAKLDAAADEAGRSLTQEVEKRLEASVAISETGETHELLAAIAGEIARAEALTGKRWHRDLKTWAMAREGLLGEIEARAPEADRLLAAGNSDANDLAEELNTYDARLRALAISSMELGGWPIPLNPHRYGDVRVRQYNYADVRAELADHGTAETKAIVEPILAKMEAIEAERSPVAEGYRHQQKVVMDCIEEAISEWEADLRSRGRQPSQEYRPPATIRPVRDASGEVTGTWVPLDVDEYVAKYLPDSGAALRNPS
jgi:hypothetical protein